MHVKTFRYHDKVDFISDRGSTTGTSLHEYSNLLEYDFGTTDGFKKKLLKRQNMIAEFQKATSEAFSDRLKCAVVLSRSPGPIRTYLEGSKSWKLQCASVGADEPLGGRG